MSNNDEIFPSLDKMTDALADLQFWGQLKALELCLRAFNINQPRVPAGTREGGRWANGTGSGSIEPIAYQGYFHDQIRDQLANDLKLLGAKVETEVTLTTLTHPPVTARIDMLVQNPLTKELFGLEIKTAKDPDFTTAQKIVYFHLPFANSVYTLDRRITNFGLPLGDPLPPMPLKMYIQGTIDDVVHIFTLP